MLVKSVYCKTVLCRSRIYGVDYAINPYTGCLHGCAYCYVPSTLKRLPKNLEWGQYVFAKINAPHVLMKEVRRIGKGYVLLSSVTDPYQPVEKVYELTRRTLEVLSRKDFPIVILTKSDLVTRDLDILKKFSNVEVGLTITTLDEKAREVLEPKAPPIKKRFEALYELKQAGISTYAFLGPLLPFFSENYLEDLFEKFREVGVDRVMVDKLNIRGDIWKRLKNVLENNYPSLVKEFKKRTTNKYYLALKNEVMKIAFKNAVKVDFCY